jgi:KUP system potassium uptake protein
MSMAADNESQHPQFDFTPATHETPKGKYLYYLALGALGVVYGDIGTSPLYAFRESFHASHGLQPSADNILGVLSLIFWSLILVISIKYTIFVMRADNHGEGGILALTALIGARRRVMLPGTVRWTLVMLGLFGTALLYGDGMITPAISVLSAVEGLGDRHPLLRAVHHPDHDCDSGGAFHAIQNRGTERVGRIFGPITLLWFVVLAVLGGIWIVRQPGVLVAVNPYYAFAFLSTTAGKAFWCSAQSSWL